MIRRPYAALAFTTRGNEPKLLHQTYVRASSEENARIAGGRALRIFVRGPFRLVIRPATPQELGCVPNGSGQLSW